MLADHFDKGVWSPQDLDHILGRYGSMIVERAGSDVQNALSSLTQWKDNIFVIPVCRVQLHVSRKLTVASN